MSTFGSVDEILDFAISNEQEAADFYANLAGKMERQEMREVFEAFSREELGHKQKLADVKEGKKLLTGEVGQRVADLRIADYLVDVEPAPEMDYRDTLILAMKKEKAAFKLYSDLAGSAEDTELKNLFLSLAQEEAKHKLRFEIEYDEHVLKWD